MATEVANRLLLFGGSADGRVAGVFHTSQSKMLIDLVEVRTGKALGQIGLPGPNFPARALAPDGRSVVVHDTEKNSLTLYPVPAGGG